MTRSFGLDARQRARFDTFGFLQFPGLFAAEAEAIIEAFEAVWRAHGGGRDRQPHTGQRRSIMVPFIDQSEHLSALIDDPRIAGIAADLLGEDFNYFTSDGNYYVGDSLWHSDWAKSGDYRVLKIAFYLDPVDRDSGALRVIPGSHRLDGDRFARELEEHALQSADAWGVEGPDVPAFSLDSQPGNVVVIDQRLKHAAFGGGNRRRMFTINLTQRFAERDIGVLRDFIGGQHVWCVHSVHGPAMLRTAGPERMRHLEQVQANQDHLPELVRQYLLTHDGPYHGNAAAVR